MSTSIYYLVELLAKVGVDTAEHEPPKVNMTLGIDPPSSFGVDLTSNYLPEGATCVSGKRKRSWPSVATDARSWL